MSSDPVAHAIERNTIFVLTALLLTAIVSISFFNLDRHPAFPPPSDELVDAIDTTESPVVFADDPVSLAVLEERQSDLDATIRPLTFWPARAPLVTFGATPGYDDHYEMAFDDSVWTLWLPANVEPSPVFETAVVEVEGADGTRRTCPRQADGAHQCGDAGWTRIRSRTLTIDGQRERCIWAHPIQDHTLRIRFADVPTLDEASERLHLETALSDAAVGTGVAVDFEVHVDDRSVSHRHADRRGWQSVLLPAIAEPSELVVEVAADEVGRRHACFRFELK